jgi:hypothetical protein
MGFDCRYFSGPGASSVTGVRRMAQEARRPRPAWEKCPSRPDRSPGMLRLNNNTITKQS